MDQRRLIIISGIVQGVGFRPFIYQLATKYALSGWVNNDSGGVQIDVQGTPDNIESFSQHIISNPPVLARIDAFNSSDLSPVERDGFYIHHSHREQDISVFITPDQSVCHECLEELRHPQSRYYQYPFTNCTNCGPRYTIIEQLPYDRCNTSMTQFEMCPECRQSYQNPLDRRYHAQPVSCAQCGPSVSLLDPSMREISSGQDAISITAQLLSQGKIVAIKGIGGFHLVCDALCKDAVIHLRELKHRHLKPFAVMAENILAAEEYVTGSPPEWAALSSSVAPIVLMKRKNNARLVSEVAPVGPYIGMMLPYTPLHVLLFDALKSMNATHLLVMTSANRSGLPLAIHRDEIENQFGQSLDGILDHNRPIVHPCDDSLVHFAGEHVRVIRMARGYAPLSLKTDYAGQTLLGMGAQQKATIALATQGQWFLSPHIGDTDNLDIQTRYQQVTHDFLSVYQCQPSAYIHDKHPGYFSSQLVSETKKPHQAIQHHYAHILAVMAEHGLEDKVIGFAFDGTGWGDDETVWGGEVILADTQGFQRCGHLRPFRLIGGEKAIREPARLLFAMLLECYSPDEIKMLKHPAFAHWSDVYFQNLYQLWASGSHSPYCTSVGRLFDVWACLLLLIENVDFEGESGLRIEDAASRASVSDMTLKLAFPWTESQVLDWEPALVTCIEQRIWVQQSGDVRACLGLIQGLVAAIIQMAENFHMYPAVLSGGVFQNRLIMDSLWQQWPSEIQPFYSGELIPVNDGGIAAGQVWYGMHQI
ncbi:Carbamoyltransferase HypF [Vibrio aerogenes CECT 7868]|uniref:Carbamoyltransferase HypF n=1 Tax=Vibrio aerogenes CECT 7868 TaxID=1216006 RepID=A0A1M5YN93_9VIBR|nr:carbamoyltransferase HypF [Vibrio aerogenes]SHI13378.1 Carbamoyltransferase HypF [Vibrio aerogenes CECT 7868]